MAPLPSISVIVPSHGRPGWLARCITSLRQLDYPSFEIIVVADSVSLDRLDKHPHRALIRTATLDAANVSEARNAGLIKAGGDLVAYIDDDAVAEPFWLRHHAEAFQTFDIAASTGFVRGRNGISYQSAVTSVDAEGETHRETSGDGRAFVPKLGPGRALKLVGTNAVYRRECLNELGGFDPAFRFFLDDTDMSLRLKSAGHLAAAVPLAQVHHAFAPSVRRTRLRAPRDLTEIGRSSAVFAMRYRGAPPEELKERLFSRERHRLVSHMVRGTCEPHDIANSLATLENGWREGAVLMTEPPAPLSHARGRFEPVPVASTGNFVITSRLLNRRRSLSNARRLAELGNNVSVFSFSLTILRHHVRYVQPGIWLQTGGQFGRSVRSASRYRWCRFADRVKEEIRRVALVRGIRESAASCDTTDERWSHEHRCSAGPGAGERDGTKGQS